MISIICGIIAVISLIVSIVVLRNVNSLQSNIEGDGIFIPKTPQVVEEEVFLVEGIAIRDVVTDKKLVNAFEKKNESLNIGQIVNNAEKPTPKKARPKKNWNKPKPN